jgi:cytochrome b561
MTALIAVVTLFEDSLSAYFRIPVKHLYAGVMVVGLGLLMVLLRLLPTPPSTTPMTTPNWLRIALASVMVVAVAYFFAREEIAAMFELPLRTADAIAVVLIGAPCAYLASYGTRQDVD